jgi:hypothetical protein
MIWVFCGIVSLALCQVDDVLDMLGTRLPQCDMDVIKMGYLEVICRCRAKKSSVFVEPLLTLRSLLFVLVRYRRWVHSKASKTVAVVKCFPPET